MFSHLTDIKRKCIEDKQRIAKKQSDLDFYPKFLSQLLSFGDDLNPNALIRPTSLRLSQKGVSASRVTPSASELSLYSTPFRRVPTFCRLRGSGFSSFDTVSLSFQFRDT